MYSPTIKIIEQEFILLKEKACYHPYSKSLLLSDLHLGKAASFQRRGIPLPIEPTRELEIISKLYKQLDFENLFILGDLLHDRFSLYPSLMEELKTWFKQNRFNTTLIIGNHDRHTFAKMKDWDLKMADRIQLEGVLLHHGDSYKGEEPSIVGHTHPVVSLTSNTDSLRVPCFAIKNGQLTLPSFGLLTGGYAIEPKEYDQVYLVGPKDVFPLKSSLNG